VIQDSGIGWCEWVFGRPYFPGPNSYMSRSRKGRWPSVFLNGELCTLYVPLLAA
jgi:hypothetical protein